MNINRDYLIINDVKKSNVKLDNGSMFFYITDKNTQNIFVNLVINVSNNDLIQKFANIENAEDYTLTMNIVKPDNTYKVVEGKLHDKEKAIFEFNLNEDCCDKIGTYRCELLTKCNINNHEEITTSNKLTYKVKSSVLNDLDDIIEAPEYPLVIQLFDKLSDINQYEEDRRANELARQLAEEQRQTRFNTLDADMVDRVNAVDSKMDDVEARISAKEQAVDKLIVDTKADIDDYKVAKDTEIDNYKTAKDTEINEAITTQDNKINEFINERNDRLDALENKDALHNSRLDAIEAKDTEQDSRLDVAENRLANIGNDITNTMQPIIDEHTSRLDAIEAIDVSQNNRLDAIEAKNQQQDDRLLDIEKVNNKQDIDIKCLYGASQTIDITKEGNSIYLQNSNNGFTIVDEIKGNTLVNCNKEPDKELILNGNINTQGYSNVTLTEGVNGGLVDVALEGNTMVNVCDQKDSVALPFNRGLTYLYANTLYAVQFVSDAVSKVNITLGGAELLNQNVAIGTNKYMITTPSELIDNNLVLNGEGFNASNIVVTEATDQDFGYFEGMKSVGECEDLEVVSSNKNLFDGELVHGYWYNATLRPDTNAVANKNNVNAQSDTTYSFYIADYTNNIYIAELDKNFNEIKSYTIKSGQHITTSILCKYLRFCTDRSVQLNTNVNIQIEEGATVTEYIPHASNTQTLTHEPLRAVGDIKDKYVLIDGKWYIERNCGYRNNYSICDAWSNENLTNRRLKLFKLDNSIEEFDDMNALRKVKSNKFKCVQYGYMDGRFNVPFLAYITENGNLWVSADINYTQQDMLNYIKDCQFVYELQTPTYEPIDYNPFTVYSEVTHISNNSTIPCNMVIKNTGYNCLLKPSTTYTVSSNLGLNTVTTPSTLTEDCLRFYDTDTSTVTTMNNVMVLEGDYTAGKPLPSHFSGIESAFEQEYDEVVGKYKVKVRVQNEDASKENYIEFYINEPLRGIGDAKDKVYVKNDKVVVERKCGQRQYQDGDFGTYLTDKVNTVYPLAEPIYEEAEYNDVKLFIESFKNSTLFYNSNIPVTSKVHYSYSVPIIDTVAQTANVTDQQDSMIIDLATQVAVMEMMLM